MATTIDAIGERSDVPAATVYRLFSSKLGILHVLLDTSIAGDDQPVPMQQRPDVAGLFAESDPGKLLADFVGIAVAINTRSNDLYRILSSAAGPIRQPLSCSPTINANAPSARAVSRAPSPVPGHSHPDCESATLPTSSTRSCRPSSTASSSSIEPGRLTATRSGLSAPSALS